MLSVIRQTRLKAGLSTTQLAHRLGVNQSTVVRMEQSEERGAISLELLQRTAKALRCSFQYSFEPLRNETEDSRENTDNYQIFDLSQELKDEDIATAKKLSGIARLRRACQLSDFTRKISKNR